MNQIDELIAKHCPTGVPYEILSDVARLKRGTSITKKQVTEGTIPVVAGGRTVAYFHGEFNRDGESIVVAGSGAYAGFVSWWEGPIFVSDAFSVEAEKERLLPRFCFHWLRSKQNDLHSLKSGGGIPHVYAKDVGKFRIPVPPLEVQRAVVEILDKFTALEAELEAELEARKKQYEHYRSVLLSPNDVAGRMVELRDLGRIVTGRTPKASNNSSWGQDVDFVTPSDIQNGMKEISHTKRLLSEEGAVQMEKNIIPSQSILVTCIGADMGKTVINSNNCVTNQQINSIILSSDEEVDVDYIFHVLTSMRDQILVLGSRGSGTMPILNKTDFSGIKIFLPALDEQKTIAQKLNSFDALVNDLSSGLPAEISARRKQYEYYRDQLLTFKELAS